MVVLVTGGNGQVGQAIRSIVADYPMVSFVFADSVKGDITDPQKLNVFFNLHRPDYCINAAAYTAVDKAESEPEKAHLINVVGARNVAEACKAHDCVLIHISTDFVFDGQKTTPYREDDAPNPQSIYGQTKLDGEREVQKVHEKHIIIRTSWVYSQFGNNFMKTMLRLAKERDSISVVNDQIGTPTNAVDLARAIMEVVKPYALSLTPYALHPYGIYHFSNQGKASWYEFAKAIFERTGSSIALHPIATADYPTPAKRPSYSLLDKTKIVTTFGLSIRRWKDALEDALGEV